MNRRPSPFARLAAAAAVTSLVLAGCADGGDDTAEDPEPSASSTPDDPADPSPSDSPDDPASEPTDDGGGDTLAVPVYFLGDGPSGPAGSRGPVLFREFRDVEADNPLDEALALLLAGDTLDPDYRSPMPSPDSAALEGVSIDGVGSDAQVVLSLADETLAERPAGMSRAEAEVAAQSIVYTVQGVAQARVRVFAELDGSPATLFGVPTENGLRNAPQLEVHSLVNVSDPGEGAGVSGTFTATGIGSSFEATIPWQVRRGDEVVLEGSAQAEGWMDRLYPWEAEVDVSGLEPGEYTFVAMTDDPTGGTEGFGPSEDTRTIVVE